MSEIKQSDASDFLRAGSSALSIGGILLFLVAPPVGGLFILAGVGLGLFAKLTRPLAVAAVSNAATEDSPGWGCLQMLFLLLAGLVFTGILLVGLAAYAQQVMP